jgi:hypothetical protein
VLPRKIVAKDMQTIQSSLASLPNYSAVKSKSRSTKWNNWSFFALPSCIVIEQTGQLFRNVNISTHHLSL